MVQLIRPAADLYDGSDSVSTRCTIAHGEGWHVYSECFDETVWVELSGSHLAFEASVAPGQGGITTFLPPAVLDAIAAAHRDQEFPHQHPDYMERADLK